MTRRFAEGSGGLDALVTAAGIQRYGTVSETTLTLWNEVLAVNLTGVFLAVRAALPWLRRADGGAITIVSSVQAFVSQGGVAAYVASKGALNAFARAVAIDEAGEGVRVNVVCPGSVDTPMLAASAELFADAHHSASELLARWGASHPLGRLATPSEVAEVAAFLLSRRAAFVTGEEIRVDGGLLAAIPVVLPERTGTER
jgi:NAD(P)-dependent dehydrogenase (short-subunit alcohol dehydrogenase family)